MHSLGFEVIQTPVSRVALWSFPHEHMLPIALLELKPGEHASITRELIERSNCSLTGAAFGTVAAGFASQKLMSSEKQQKRRVMSDVTGRHAIRF